MKTVNRGWLRKQIEQGKIEAKCDYHLTDDYKADDANNMGKTGWMVARIRKPVFETYTHLNGVVVDRCVHDDFVAGQMNFMVHDFKTKRGSAWEEANGHIAFLVHSNASYTLRIRQTVPVKPRVRIMAVAKEVV